MKINDVQDLYPFPSLPFFSFSVEAVTIAVNDIKYIGRGIPCLLPLLLTPFLAFNGLIRNRGQIRKVQGPLPFSPFLFPLFSLFFLPPNSHLRSPEWTLEVRGESKGEG